MLLVYNGFSQLQRPGPVLAPFFIFPVGEAERLQTGSPSSTAEDHYGLHHH